MVQYEHLRTASLYINNQLLSRGLLKDGQTIDFCDPDRCEGGAAETMGKIMSVVNDLILRRDRDADHRESLSTTLRAVRAESLRQTNDLTRITERQAETQRRLASAESAEAAAKSQLKTAESAIRGLKEEMARARTMVAQTRASCANEVRKRDRQIESLKKHVADAGRTRGASRSNAITTIHITGEFGGVEAGGVPPGTAEEDYDLSAETNGFLTELAKGLSVENDALLALIRRTLASLREMGGLDKESQPAAGDGHVLAYQSNCDEISTDLDNVLEHLRAILSNPSFVPIEEVEVREEEIQRLREGWEKMETRWKEAVHLIDGWRRRMLSNGKGVNMEELKMGLRLSPVRVREVLETNQGFGPLPLSAVREEDEEEELQDEKMPESPCPREPLELIPAPEYEEDGNYDSDSDGSSEFHDVVELEDLEVEEPNIEILEQSIAIENPWKQNQPHGAQQPLQESDSAANRANGRSKPGEFTTIIEENTLEVQEASMPPPPKPAPRPAAARKKPDPPSFRNGRPPSPPPSNSSTSSTEQSRSRPQLRAKPKPQPLPRTQRPLPSKPTTENTARARRPAPRQATKPGPQTATARTKMIKRHTPSPVPAPEPAADTTSQPTSRAASAAESTHPDAISTASPATTTTTTTTTDPNKMTVRSTTPESADELALGAGNNPPSPERPAHQDTATRQTARTPGRDSNNINNNNPSTDSRDRSPLRRGAGSRLPLPANAPVQPSPQLTMASIAAKLAASEREADAARVRAKLRAARGGGATKPAQKRSTEHEPAKKPVKGPSPIVVVGMGSVSSEEGGGVALGGVSVGSSADAAAAVASDGGSEGAAEEEEEEEEAVVVVEKTRKRERRASKAANRRRSTLSPWEMQSLITGQVVESPSKGA